MQEIRPSLATMFVLRILCSSALTLKKIRWSNQRRFPVIYRMGLVATKTHAIIGPLLSWRLPGGVWFWGRSKKVHRPQLEKLLSYSGKPQPGPGFCPIFYSFFNWALLFSFTSCTHSSGMIPHWQMDGNLSPNNQDCKRALPSTPLCGILTVPVFL